MKKCSCISDQRLIEILMAISMITRRLARNLANSENQHQPTEAEKSYEKGE